jgi:hypothetical protein
MPNLLQCCSVLVLIPHTKSADGATKSRYFCANRSTEGQTFNMGANEITLSVYREAAWPF